MLKDKIIVKLDCLVISELYVWQLIASDDKNMEYHNDNVQPVPYL